MTSVAKEVKKALNEGEELADKQARLKDLKQEYSSLKSKIDDMWAEYSQKMAITTDANAQREISNNFYKSLEPLNVAVRNKAKEIYKLTDEIAASKQTISQSEFSKKLIIQMIIIMKIMMKMRKMVHSNINLLFINAVGNIASVKV